MKDNPSTGFHTRAAQTYADGKKENRPLSTPILQSTNFQAASSEQLGSLFKAKSKSFYTRFGHPTLAAAAEKVALLEGAEKALVFASGMGAITTALLAVLKSGDHVVAQRNIFAQTFNFLNDMARGYGVETTFVDATHKEEVVEALRPHTALLYVESPSNPLLKVVDIRALADLVRERNIPLFIDSTFASPYVQNPLALGATLVLHSGTKYLGGHSDVMCGAAAGDARLIRRIQEAQVLLGNIMDPHAAWLLLRGLKTLGVRVQRQCDTALEVARFLESQEGIVGVNYPWLESSPYFALAKQQMRGGGGVLAFEVDGGLKGARAFLDALELIPVASSLGGVETVIEIPYELDFSEEELGEAAGATGISLGLIRLAVGIEDAGDLISDLQRGVAALRLRQSVAAT
jgi:methionine-gamma-lyase